ncbi:transposase [Aliarcobacter butzleri]
MKERNRYLNKIVCTVLELKFDGKKEILKLYLSESESTNFWLSILSNLNN